ncbi:MAG: hypothetical protein FWG81_05690 [Betaproteobacteria bacterium]|nr:hypothetical protein [Betaproteobacteria bacterium]
MGLADGDVLQVAMFGRDKSVLQTANLADGNVQGAIYRAPTIIVATGLSFLRESEQEEVFRPYNHPLIVQMP